MSYGVHFILQSEENSTVISWVHTVSEMATVTRYAFTYPFTYSELQSVLEGLDRRFPPDCSTLYYHRELLVYSLDHWRVDLVTVSSHVGRGEDREERLPGLFPEDDQLRPYRFPNKKVVFVSARVHPGETSSSFVLNGFLNFIVSSDPRAVKLRDMFVFKLIPLLNPDGVIRGHYRTDQRGVNLNRVYVDPSPSLHPTIYAARQIILYHHHGQLTPSSTDETPSLSTIESSDHATTTCTSEDNRSSSIMSTSKEPPVVMDEDTCHSFSDVQGAKTEGGSGTGERIRGMTLMEMDEPSASGWDISSNISVDGGTSSSFQRGLPSSELHDDCSNVSGISEAETGVTSMFGSMSAVSDFTNIISRNKSCGQNPSAVISSCISEKKEEAVELNVSCDKSRDLFLKDFHKESDKEHGDYVCDQRTSHETENKKDINVFSNVNMSRLMPVPSTVSSQHHFKMVAGESNVDSGSYPFGTSQTKDSLEYKQTLTTSSTQIPKTLKTGSPPTPGSISSRSVVREGCGIASSSESEAECGRPGKESEVSVGVLEGSLHLPGKEFTPALNPPTPIPEETQVTSGLFLYVDLHGHASKKGESSIRVCLIAE